MQEQEEEEEEIERERERERKKRGGGGLFQRYHKFSECSCLDDALSILVCSILFKLLIDDNDNNVCLYSASFDDRNTLSAFTLLQSP